MSETHDPTDGLTFPQHPLQAEQEPVTPVEIPTSDSDTVDKEEKRDPEDERVAELVRQGLSEQDAVEQARYERKLEQDRNG